MSPVSRAGSVAFDALGASPNAASGSHTVCYEWLDEFEKTTGLGAILDTSDSHGPTRVLTRRSSGATRRERRY